MVNELIFNTTGFPCGSAGQESTCNMGVIVKLLSHVQLFATPWTIQLLEFFRPEYWSGQPFPSPGDLPNPGIKLRSPALQADSLPAGPQGKPKNTGWVACPFSRASFQPRDRTQVSFIVGRFFTSWATREALLPENICSSEIPTFPSSEQKPILACLLPNKWYQTRKGVY